MKTSDELAIEYARNRAEFRELNKKIDGLPYETRDELLKIAEEWKSCNEDMGSHEQWAGWVNLLNSYDYEEEGDSDICRLANWWDERSALAAPLGDIRRAIAARGRKLIREMEQANG